MGISDPHDVAAYDAALPEITVGPVEAVSGSIVVCDYDSAWPGLYEREAARVRAALEIMTRAAAGR